jgi:hypothetical protein
VNRVVPGSRVTVIGIYSIFQSRQTGVSHVLWMMMMMMMETKEILFRNLLVL